MIHREEVHTGKAEAEIITLPIDPYLFKVRYVAMVLMIREGVRRDRFWKQEVDRHYAKLIVSGFKGVEAMDKLEIFKADIRERIQFINSFTQ